MLQARKTATYIHDIHNKCILNGNMDEAVDHLQLISLQLLNTKINFTSHGLFPLKWNLFTKVSITSIICNLEYVPIYTYYGLKH